ncbi:hypothetical protein DSCW_35950 [Desulfosarcina widdelii]|uniref:Uncharacterized protein n=1 Tax=Desulfosarcina widdelii TaxID=947919 RepID=A0A5K7Z597_9BACT|nr:hypothetical protein [Desulfosarcina widdelii]BBO76178.1 hypothetical protein DSCW_35950 [Desulfosarcina widdelii]
MKKMNYNNKFMTAHDELVNFCRKCEKDGKKTCEWIGVGCKKFKGELERLYYEKLYPFHPCTEECLPLPACQRKRHCDEYWFFIHSRCTAENELKDLVSFYASDKSPLIGGPRLVITKEYINSDPRLKKEVDFDVTEKYITEMKSSAYYTELLDTVRQYQEYCDLADQFPDESFFNHEFYTGEPASY